MSDQFVAEIRMFGCNFAPKYWAFCNGQLLPISQNTALFSLLGTVYGGNGVSTFALPNLQGSVPVQQGQGPGLSNWDLGQQSGSDTVTLIASEMPSHTHALQASATDATTPNPAGNRIGQGKYNSGAQRGLIASYQTTAPNVTMADTALQPAGGSQPHNNLMPYLAMNYCIALQGIFPPRP